VSGHKDRVRHEQTASRTRPSAESPPTPHNASIRIPCHCCAAQSCGKTRHSASAAWIANRADDYLLRPETRWPYAGLIGASGGARQSSVVWGDPASAPIGWLGWKESRRTARLRSFVQRLLRLRDHVAEHSDRRNLRGLKRVGRAIAPHCGSVERGSGRIFLVPRYTTNMSC